MQRLAYKEQPVLHIHRYVVTVGRMAKKKGEKYSVKFHYCLNRNEVGKLKNSKAVCKGDIIEVYRATHEYIEGWQK